MRRRKDRIWVFLCRVQNVAGDNLRDLQSPDTGLQFDSARFSGFSTIDPIDDCITGSTVRRLTDMRDAVRSVDNEPVSRPIGNGGIPPLRIFAGHRRATHSAFGV